MTGERECQLIPGDAAAIIADADQFDTCLLYTSHQHTHAPWNSSFSRDTDANKGPTHSAAEPTPTRLRVPVNYLRYCPECIEEDLKFWNFSYWRKSHHFPGVDWYTKHFLSLIHISMCIRDRHCSGFALLIASSCLHSTGWGLELPRWVWASSCLDGRPPEFGGAY